VTKVRPDVSQTFSDIIDKCLDKKQDTLRRRDTVAQGPAPLPQAGRGPEDDDDDEGGGDVGVVPGMSMARQQAAAAAAAAHDYFGWRRSQR